MAVPIVYDPDAPSEKPVPLPDSPPVPLELCANDPAGTYLQPPLSRRGHGPGLVFVLPSLVRHPFPFDEEPNAYKTLPLDPTPVFKWAEEGFAIAAVHTDRMPDKTLHNCIKTVIDKLGDHPDVDIKDKFAIMIYDPEMLDHTISLASSDARIRCAISMCGSISLKNSRLPTLLHIPSTQNCPTPENAVCIHKYSAESPYFVIPEACSAYHPSAANMAHSRTLVFLRSNLGGPYFDIEAIWEEHTHWEFGVRSIAQTMGTMVAEPYVNHVPTMTGGMGRRNLIAFYRDHFIFANPADAALETVSRTVGPDRIIDEMIFKMTHDRVVDYLLPGIPPTEKYMEVPLIAVVNVRGDRLYHEHIWWDQATVLKQIGLLPKDLEHPKSGLVRTPVAGSECSRVLSGVSSTGVNKMLEREWQEGPTR